MSKLRLAIPNGHLNDATLSILSSAGYRISGEKRTYRPAINDHHIDLRMLRPQEIPIFVSEGIQDVGITGYDWMCECGVDVELLVDLEYSPVRIVVAVPNEMNSVNSLGDLIELFAQRGKQLRVFTEYLTLAKRALLNDPVYKKYYGSSEPMVITPWWRTGSNSQVGVYLSFGATEAKPPTAADAIVEVVDTGTSLEQNGLKPVATLLKSTAVLIANRQAMEDPVKREKIADIMTLLRGVVEGRKKLHVFINVQRDRLEELLSQLPALQSPTVSQLSDPNWVAVNTVVDRTEFLSLIPKLRRLAQGLVVFEPRQVLPLVTDGGRDSQ
ncbi:MAG: ATP phosphoribosyltransferase [Candidatus Thorarchaeota archaeon]|nr:ATP phosphoribosyltransferase [Candidatus Thorarchaeota archaeon]